MDKHLIKLQDSISSIDYDKAKDSTFIEYSNTRLYKLHIIKKTIVELGLFYCSKTEYSSNLKTQTGVITNYLSYNYNYSLKGKKVLFFKLLKDCLITKVNFYLNHKKQVLVNIDKLILLMKNNSFEMDEKQYLKIDNTISNYDMKDRSNNFKTVQQFKNRLDKYITTNINNIEVKKIDNEYVVTSPGRISIPYSIKSIKGLKVKLVNIDDKFNHWSKKYEIINFKEKELHKLTKIIDELNYNLIVKQEVFKQTTLQKGKGSNKSCGKISDRGIERVVGVPKDTQSNWKKCEDDNYRNKIYWLLKNYTEDQLIKMIEDSQNRF